MVKMIEWSKCAPSRPKDFDHFDHFDYFDHFDHIDRPPSADERWVMLERWPGDSIPGDSIPGRRNPDPSPTAPTRMSVRPGSQSDPDLSPTRI